MQQQIKQDRKKKVIKSRKSAIKIIKKENQQRPSVGSLKRLIKPINPFHNYQEEKKTQVTKNQN